MKQVMVMMACVLMISGATAMGQFTPLDDDFDTGSLDTSVWLAEGDNAPVLSGSQVQLTKSKITSVSPYSYTKGVVTFYVDQSAESSLWGIKPADGSTNPIVYFRTDLNSYVMFSYNDGSGRVDTSTLYIQSTANLVCQLEFDTEAGYVIWRAKQDSDSDWQKVGGATFAGGGAAMVIHCNNYNLSDTLMIDRITVEEELPAPTQLYFDDDFDDASLDTTVWEPLQGQIVESGSTVTLTNAGGVSARMQTRGDYIFKQGGVATMYVDQWHTSGLAQLLTSIDGTAVLTLRTDLGSTIVLQVETPSGQEQTQLGYNESDLDSDQLLVRMQWDAENRTIRVQARLVSEADWTFDQTFDVGLIAQGLRLFLNCYGVEDDFIIDRVLTQQYPVFDDCEEALSFGYNLSADLNSDCYVEWADFGIFASQWQQCMNPTDAACDTPWWN